MPPYRVAPYPPDVTFGSAYERVRQFLLRINRGEVVNPYFPWAAWEWIFCLGYVDEEEVQKYVQWEEDGVVVGLSSFDGNPARRYLDFDPTRPGLMQEMLAWSLAHHTGEEPFQVNISDADADFQHTARRMGMTPTQETEHASALDLRGALEYSLPENFTIRSQADGFDLHKFNRCLWHGFDRKGDVDVSEQRLDFRRRQLSGPNQLPELNIVVVAPDGEYAAYCGMWHEAGASYTYVEPVCTAPAWRKHGCGRAAVLESARRCAARGARTAYVVSNLDFYYRIGFNPLPAARWWSTV